MNTVTLSADEVVVLAADFNAMANAATAMLNDPAIASSLTDKQSCSLQKYDASCSSIAANLATWAAQIAFASSDNAFATIKTQTKSACDTADRLKTTIAKIQHVIDILGAAVALGTEFNAGTALSILTSAGTLQGVIAKAA